MPPKTFVSLISAFLCVTLIFIGSVFAEELAAPTENKGSANPPLQLNFKPQSLQFNIHTRYDDEGRVSTQQQSGSLTINAFYNPKTLPVGYKDVTLTRVVADNGLELSPLPNSRSYPYFNSNRSGEHPFFSFTVMIPYPPADVHGFSEISGTLTVQVGTPPLKQIVLPPLKDILGKHVRIEGLANTHAWVEIRVSPQYNQNDQTIMVEMPNDLLIQLSSVALVTPQDARTILKYSGGSGGCSKSVRYYQAPSNGDSRLELEFYSGIDEVPVKFSLHDLPLIPQAVFKKQEAATQPVPAPSAEKSPAPSTGELKAVIEQ